MIGRSERVFPPARSDRRRRARAGSRPALGRATEGLARALEERDVDVVRALSFEDGRSIVVDRRLAAARSCSTGTLATTTRAPTRRRRRSCTSCASATAGCRSSCSPIARAPRGPSRSKSPRWSTSSSGCSRTRPTSSPGACWPRSSAIARRILPPYARALAEYSQVREHSWSAPGHQGGIAFTKLPAGRAFFDFYGENLVPHRHGHRARPARLAARSHRPRRGERAVRGARLRRAPQLLGRRRHLGIESHDHAGVHERGRPGRARPELPQVDRAGPDADRRAARSTCSPRATATGSSGRFRRRRWSRRRSARRRRPARSRATAAGPEAGLLGGHQLHLRRALLQRREGAGSCSRRAATGSTSTRRGTATRASTRCTQTTSPCAAIRRDHSGPDGVRHALDAQAAGGAVAGVVHPHPRREGRDRPPSLQPGVHDAHDDVAALPDRRFERHQPPP